MKRTYIKITVLICALVIAVMMLGGTLFTYVMISKINSDYMSEIQSAVSYEPYDEERKLDSSEAHFLMLSENFSRIYGCTNNPNIGYYGTSDWHLIDGTASSVYISTDFHRASAVVESEDEETVNMKLISGRSGDGASFLIYSKNNGDSDIDIFEGAFSQPFFTDEQEKSVVISIDQPDEIDKTVSELDQEAERIFNESIKEGPVYRPSDETRIGWLTSYAYFSNSSYYYKSSLYVVTKDAFVYHPLAIVFERYAYAFYLFPFVLIILLALTIFTMRRMYVNRMRYETRTRNLTRSFAHELKTPLAVTKSYIENWDIVEESEREEVAAKINFEVDHMTRMVNTLLDLSKMDAGDVTLNLEDVELFDLSKVCLIHMEELARSHNINVELTKDSEYGEYTVSADLDMIRIVISNFLSNAIKYGKQNVVISLSGSGSNVIFRITNDGEPISRKEQKKIWDLFYKKDKSGSDRLSSNGVGLAVNKSILELHKAKFGIDSSDSSTTFWFEMKKAKQ